MTFSAGFPIFGDKGVEVPITGYCKIERVETTEKSFLLYGRYETILKNKLRRQLTAILAVNRDVIAGSSLNGILQYTNAIDLYSHPIAGFQVFWGIETYAHTHRGACGD